MYFLASRFGRNRHKRDEEVSFARFLGINEFGGPVALRKRKVRILRFHVPLFSTILSNFPATIGIQLQTSPKWRIVFKIYDVHN